MVRKLIAGPSVYICDGCIEICNEIIADDAASQEPSVLQTGIGSEPVVEVYCSVCRLRVPASGSLLVPERGQICPACLEAIKAAMG